ncbi:hypothetical protein EV215_0867 [Hypnocyclicus thermotrophus]|uniref:HEAT repeat protein n=1 Tax=Hypnocyclicus thermotrophus TaxID=1627895 RepID=A0AA46I606_9FUSO|nr:HEAT repeat domain-containing protein [Hypnocyclicus thermotrophus]TDT71491.1 hypothetical protein EV215_0867 [Hypnocyclicus thermotrophus]
MSKYYEFMYVEKLGKNVSKDEKVKAITELGKMKSIVAKDSLIKIAKNENESFSVRESAIHALIEIGDASFLDNFLPLSKIQDEDILELLIYGIKKLKAEEYVKYFKDFIDNENINIKLEIIDTLNIIHTEEAIKLLLKYYNSKEKEIKNLIRLYIQDSKVFLDYIENMSEIELLNILGLIPAEKALVVLKKLISEVTDKNIIKILISSIADLHIKGTGELYEELFDKLEEKEDKIKLIESLENVENNEKNKFLLRLLDNSDRDIRAKALTSFTNIEEEEILEKLKTMLFTENEWWLIKKLVIMLLGKSKNLNIFKQFVLLLSEESDERIIRTLIVELGNLKNEKAIPYIKKYITSNKQDIRKVAIESLAKLGYNEILEDVLKENNVIENIKFETIDILLNYKDERVEKILIEILNKRRYEKPIMERAIKMVEEFQIPFKLFKDFVIDKKVDREIRAKLIVNAVKYDKNSVEKLFMKILETDDEWWMLKKIVLLVVKDMKLYNLIDIVIKYVNNIDERLSKTAKDVAKSFYGALLVEKLKDEDIKNIAEKFMKII